MDHLLHGQHPPTSKAQRGEYLMDHLLHGQHPPTSKAQRAVRVLEANLDSNQQFPVVLVGAEVGAYRSNCIDMYVD